MQVESGDGVGLCVEERGGGSVGGGDLAVCVCGNGKTTACCS